MNLAAQPHEILIVLILFTGAYILPMAMTWYYTPVRPRGHVSTAQWIRYFNDRDSSYRYRIRWEIIFYINIILPLIFLAFFNWLTS